MLKKVKLTGLIAIVGAAALLPLYGDPRNAPVTHAEWARLLLRGLHMEDVVQQTAAASQVFAILSWKESLSLRADRYLSADEVRIEEQGDRRQVIATGEVGEVTYTLAVVRGGDYRVRVQVAGSPVHPASAELARAGEIKAFRAFTIRPGSTMGWIDVGSTHLDRGAYVASLLLPRGTALERVEVAPPCLMPIEPPGGWNAPRVITSEAAAVTIVQALDRQAELPPAASAIDADAAQFVTESGLPAVAGAGVLQAAVRGGVTGTRAVIWLDLPEPGLYTVSAFGVKGAGQSWTADGCLKSVVCADKDAAAGLVEWRPVLTAEFASGRHTFTVVLAPGAAIQRVRAERKKDSADDYAAALRRLGFDVGPPGPMARTRALDAMRFLEGRGAALREPSCGDVVLPPGPTVRAALEPAPVAGPARAPLNAGPGVPPLGAGPGVPIGEPPTGPTPTVSPTPLPPPPTLPSPDVASPVQPVFPSPRPQP